MNEKVSYKISENGKRWEETEPLHPITPQTEEHIWDIAYTLANLFNREVRWNYVGSSQGHYASPVVCHPKEQQPIKEEFGKPEPDPVEEALQENREFYAKLAKSTRWNCY